MTMRRQPSSFLKMTFETSVQFIKEAALFGHVEPLRSPSAKIIVGQETKCGTGCMDILYKFDY